MSVEGPSRRKPAMLEPNMVSNKVIAAAATLTKWKPAEQKDLGKTPIVLPVNSHQAAAWERSRAATWAAGKAARRTEIPDPISII